MTLVIVKYNARLCTPRRMKFHPYSRALSMVEQGDILEEGTVLQNVHYFWPAFAEERLVPLLALLLVAAAGLVIVVEVEV